MIIVSTGQFKVCCITRWERPGGLAGAVGHLAAVFVTHGRASQAWGRRFRSGTVGDITSNQGEDSFPVVDDFSSSPGSAPGSFEKTIYVDVFALYRRALAAIELELTGEFRQTPLITSRADLDLLERLAERMRAEIALHSLSGGDFSRSGVSIHSTDGAGRQRNIWTENGIVLCRDLSPLLIGAVYPVIGLGPLHRPDLGAPWRINDYAPASLL